MLVCRTEDGKGSLRERKMEAVPFCGRTAPGVTAWLPYCTNSSVSLAGSKPSGVMADARDAAAMIETM